MAAARTRFSAGEAEGSALAPLGEHRDLDRLEELDLAHEPVAPGEAARAAGTAAHRELVQHHGVAPLEHLGVVDTEQTRRCPARNDQGECRNYDCAARAATATLALAATTAAPE